MSTGSRCAQFAAIIVLCLGSLAASSQSHPKTHKTKKPQLAPLPSGPTGPIQQIPLDSMAPVPPHVTYDKGQLSIVAANSTLGDILRAVRKQTGADIDVPDAKERVVTNLGPGPAQEIIAELLNGSRYNYVLLGSPQDPGVLTRVVLVAKTGPDRPGPGAPGQGPAQAAAAPEPAQPDMAEAAEPENPAPEENAEENNVDQATTEPEQPQGQPDQSAVKTPQQLLQEMQQRQLQLQQQQQTGTAQPGAPGVPVPQRPQENQ